MMLNNSISLEDDEFSRIIEYLQKCRTCLEETSEHRGIFDKDVEENPKLSFHEMLTFCAADSWEEFDESIAPKFLCMLCIEKLRIAYAYKKMIKQTNMKLSEIANPLSIVGDNFTEEYLLEEDENEDDENEDEDEFMELNNVNNIFVIDPDSPTAVLELQQQPCAVQIDDNQTYLIPEDESVVNERLENFVYFQIPKNAERSIFETQYDNNTKLKVSKAIKTVEAGVEEHNQKIELVYDISSSNEDESEHSNMPIERKVMVAKIGQLQVIPESVAHKAADENEEEVEVQVEVTDDIYNMEILNIMNIGTDSNDAEVPADFDQEQISNADSAQEEVELPYNEANANQSDILKVNEADVCNVMYEETIETFNDDEHLEKVSSTQPDLKKYNSFNQHECVECGKSFRTRASLLRHAKIHGNQYPHKCKICNKSFKLRRGLLDHCITHTSQKPYQCNICQNFYRTSSSLCAHKRTHRDIKPYKCDICGRGFAAFDHMRRHRLTHTGERPYKCEQCEKAYYDLSSLRQHILQHQGIKLFSCEICLAKFTQKSGYKKHLLIHEGRKDYHCPHCERAFTHKSNLSSHMKLHSKECSYKCEQCTESFQTKRRLACHYRLHEKERLAKPVLPDNGVAGQNDIIEVDDDGAAQQNNERPTCSKNVKASDSNIVLVL